MNKIFILTLTALSLIGCGDSSKSDEKMEIAKLYTVKKGDKVIRSDENIPASIKVHHTDGSGESVVELVKGKATLVHK